MFGPRRRLYRKLGTDLFRPKTHIGEPAPACRRQWLGKPLTVVPDFNEKRLTLWAHGTLGSQPNGRGLGVLNNVGAGLLHHAQQLQRGVARKRQTVQIVT